MIVSDFFTGYKLVYLLKYRDEAGQALFKAISYIFTQFQVKVRIIRFDNEGAFISQSTIKQMEYKSILYLLSAPHIPAQNGKAEAAGDYVNTSACYLA